MQRWWKTKKGERGYGRCKEVAETERRRTQEIENTGRYNKIKKDIGRKRESYVERGRITEWRFWGGPVNPHRFQCMLSGSYSRKWWSRNRGGKWNDCNNSEKTWGSKQNEGRTVKVPSKSKKKEEKSNWQFIFENEEKLM